MFNALFSIVKNIVHFNSISAQIEILLSYFEADYIKDANAKDAAIDAVIQILQAHKSNQGKPQ